MRAWQKIVIGGTVLLSVASNVVQAAELKSKKPSSRPFYGFFNPASDTIKPAFRFSPQPQDKSNAIVDSIALSNGEACGSVLIISKARLDAGDIMGAIDLLNKAIAQMPGVPDLFDMRGYAHLRAWNFKQAALDYRRAIDLNPNEAIYYIGLGSALAMLNDFKGTKKAFNDALDAANRNKSMSKEEKRSLKDDIKQLIYDLEEGGNGQ